MRQMITWVCLLQTLGAVTKRIGWIVLSAMGGGISKFGFLFHVLLVLVHYITLMYLVQ